MSQSLSLLGSIFDAVHNCCASSKAPLIAIDGRCAAGKTTLAERMHVEWGCNVIHMDDFFLRESQRSEERLLIPGGNVDWERFLEEVLIPFERGVSFSYRPFDCHMQDFKHPIWVVPDRLTVVEGSYCCHPQLWDRYALHIFMSVAREEQLRRIRLRNGDGMLEVYRNKWIPLEERYFEELNIPQRCELRLFGDNPL